MHSWNPSRPTAAAQVDPTRAAAFYAEVRTPRSGRRSGASRGASQPALERTRTPLRSTVFSCIHCVCVARTRTVLYLLCTTPFPTPMLV